MEHTLTLQTLFATLSAKFREVDADTIEYSAWDGNRPMVFGVMMSRTDAMVAYNRLVNKGYVAR